MKVYNNYASKLIIFKVSRHFFQSNLFTYYLFPMNKCDIHFFYRNTLYRSSRPEVFCKKGVIRNFTKFTGKHLASVSFLIKLQAQVCNFIKKEALAQVFSCEFCEILRTMLVADSYFIRTLRLRLPKSLEQFKNNDQAGCKDPKKTSRVRNRSDQLKFDTQMSNE